MVKFRKSKTAIFAAIFLLIPGAEALLSFVTQPSDDSVNKHSRITPTEGRHAGTACWGATDDSSITCSSSSQRDMNSLKDWSVVSGIELIDGLNLAPNGGNEWGLSLQKSTKAGTAVLRVPKSLVLSSADVPGLDTSSAQKVIQSHEMEDHWPTFLLMLRILVEKAKGSESDWFPWLESLPVSFTTGIFMDEVERSHLPALTRGLVKLQDRQLEVFNKAVQSLSDDLLSTELKNDSDLLRWAFSIVFTRSHRYSTDTNSKSEVIPLGDLFNHRDPADVIWNDTPDFVEFVLREDIEVPPGESRDIYLSYGLPNPHRFLAIFGFVDDYIAEVPSQVMFTNPTPEMVAMGCNDPRRMVFRSEDGLIANAVWDSILYSVLASNPSEQKELYEAHMQGDRKAKAEIHSRYALEVSMALKNHVEQALVESYSEVSELPTTDEGDHPTLLLIAKHKKLIREVFQKVKTRLDGIVDMEWRRRAASKTKE